MDKKSRAKAVSSTCAGLAVLIFGVAASDAVGSGNSPTQEVAEHHISVVQDKRADDLATLLRDRKLVSTCQGLAQEYTSEMYGGIISIIEQISETGNTSYSLHESMVPYGEAYVDAQCPVGQMVWMSHQKRVAVTYVMEEFLPDIIAAFAETAA